MSENEKTATIPTPVLDELLEDLDELIETSRKYMENTIDPKTHCRESGVKEGLVVAKILIEEARIKQKWPHTEEEKCVNFCTAITT